MKSLTPIQPDPSDRLLELLTEDGYRPTQVAPYQISVKIEGGFYLIESDPGDKGFFQIVYPNLWVEENSVNIWNLIDACNHANMRAKFVKCYESQHAVHCVIQVLCDGPDEFYKNFARSVSAIKFAANCFTQRMNENLNT